MHESRFFTEALFATFPKLRIALHYIEECRIRVQSALPMRITMIKKILSHPLIQKLINRETISYLFWGCATTIVNWVANYICYDILHISTMWSTVIAWLLAVIFAFFVNKLFVFHSRSWSVDVVYREFVPFISCRLLSGLFDVAFMVVAVDHLHVLNALAKLLSNVFVMIANYFASKFLIFRKK